MNNCDYEIRGWFVEWKTGGKKHRKDGFDKEESAVNFAKEKLETTADWASVIKEEHAVGWW